MQKNISLGPDSVDPQPECKKIQDYIYRFSDQIGMGNFSKVFKGTHQITSKQVAIKIIQLNSLTNTRLQQLLNTQTKILKVLSHPNVIGCQQILSSVRNCYIITQLCNGGDLQKKLKKAGQFKQKQIYQIVVDVYEGLKYLAKKQIVHRDIKVSNIFINNGVHKIADFGFAQLSQNQFRDISVGSPIYMSPEGYINNLYGPKTDVWAFGVLVYELVEGKTPCFQCRTQAQLRQRLMKQIDYTSFSAQISSELKNLIIQCLDTNPAKRINALDIQHTEWMKKAYRMVNQHTKNQQKQSLINNNASRNYKKILQINNKPTEISPLTPTTNITNLSTPLASNTRQSYLKNNLHKFTHILKTQQKQDYDHRKKHSTLDKPPQLSINDSAQTKHTSDNNKIFYSPKNAITKFQKPLGVKNVSPNGRYDSFNLKNKVMGQQNISLKLNNKTTNVNTYHQLNREDRIKQNNWMEKPPSRQGKQSNFSQRIQKQQIKQRNSNFNPLQINQQGKQIKQQVKRNQKSNLAHQYKNYFHSNHLTQVSTPISHHYQKHISKTSEESTTNSNDIQKPKQKGDHFECKVLKAANGNRRPDHQQKSQFYKEIKTPIDKIERTNPMSNKIIGRSLKFGDCIGLIHYCRLCYKFASLLDEHGQSEQAKQFLTSWSVQLLLELSSKIQQSDLMLNNQNTLINNPSININGGENQKRKKLRDVIQEYLNKYGNVLKSSEKTPTISLKQASSFIYNLYLVKGHEFKQRTKDKKSHLYFALLCYVSVLDKQTRNLMQFTYEIKNSLEGRQVQRLLNIKITDFTRKHVEQIVSEGAETTTGDT